ncbi:hypothetical protein AWB74_05232 [Caballeronia arvi]|uniref:Uncharacterized protein n=1 Tax=Caballeronia arvi TaxID=1777135 RepID=A0A158KAR7_9BURK|nr:hypothetical protein AWB74_05232 [Caballeronia arvi]
MSARGCKANATAADSAEARESAQSCVDGPATLLRHAPNAFVSAGTLNTAV